MEMKKLTLFDIKLKCVFDEFNGYVAADNASEAEEMARKMVLADHVIWWAQRGRSIELEDMKKDGKTPSEDDLDKILQEQIEALRNMRLTMLEEMGKVLI
jgi:hypothetical protein